MKIKSGLKQILNKMKIVNFKVLLVISILIFKTLIWFIFRDQIFLVSKYFCENFGLVPIGKQDLFNGLPISMYILKISYLIIDLMIDFVIISVILIFIKNYRHKNFIFKYLFLSFLALAILVYFL
jgi:hypothetical protein